MISVFISFANSLTFMKKIKFDVKLKLNSDEVPEKQFKATTDDISTVYRNYPNMVSIS